MGVKKTGEFSEMPLEEAKEPFNTILNAIGKYGVDVMRQKTSQHDFSGDLTNSIMWRTAIDKSEMGVADASEIDVPEIPNAVDIGSALEYAYYREHGAGKHVTDYKSDEFVSSLADWMQERFGISPDSSEGYPIFKKLLQNVRDHLDAEPFAINSVDEIRAYASKVATKVMSQYWNSKTKQWGNV